MVDGCRGCVENLCFKATGKDTQEEETPAGWEGELARYPCTLVTAASAAGLTEAHNLICVSLDKQKWLFSTKWTKETAKQHIE